MSEPLLPPEVTALIVRHIDSVVRLEVLLWLYRSPTVPQSAAAVARELRIDPAWAEVQLGELATRRFAARSEAAPEMYQYWPASPDIAAAVDSLARAFAERRVAVISAIYSQPPDPITSLSDAFRLRKPKAPGGAGGGGEK